MSTVSATEVRSIVEAVLAELSHDGGATEPSAARPAPAVPQPAESQEARPQPATSSSSVSSRGTVAAADVGGADVGGADIDVPDPTGRQERRRVGVENPVNATGIVNLAGSTSARLAVGRAGPRPRTRAVLLFGADHAVTQDAIFGDVPTELLEQFGLFTVQTRVTDQEEYLLRPDLGRLLDDESRTVVAERCVKKPQVQIVVGDGLSAAAVTNNLPQIYPVMEQGLQSAGLTLGTPFFVRYCRVGVMNDINDIVEADVVVLLIGERPGLGVADAMSVYSGWRPTAGKSDAHRDVICMITANGGTNPLEAGAFVVEHVKNVVHAQASGVELRLKQSEGR
ncbi:MAG TPA: ethanolamine ammonia-lyase subunit EutC [Nocardioidaceae bacterium]|nr:ethanolamine ammonia-lyase subunit EutC [Nocardioidaceae bacterium]